jgi:hypothetical protein
MASRHRGWLRVILDRQLHTLCDGRTVDAVEQRESHVGATGHPGGRDHLSTLDDALVGVASAERFELLLSRPVRGCVHAVEDPRGGQIQRTGTHAGGPRGRGVDLAEPLHKSIVPVGEQLARHDDDVRSGHLGEGGRRDERAVPSVVGHRPGVAGHEHDVVPWDVGEHLERPDDVEDRESRVERERDLHD